MGPGAAWDALFEGAEPYHGPAPPPFFSALPAGATVLDLGCGAGKSLRPLLGRGWRVLALDASPPALRRAAALAPVARADAAALPLGPGSVDAVRVHFLLGHLLPEERALAAGEVARVLRPGGALEVREFAAGDLRDGLGRPAGPGTWARGGIATHYFGPGGLAALFPAVQGEERVGERAVRFAARPRRVVELRATRA